MDQNLQKQESRPTIKSKILYTTHHFYISKTIIYYVQLIFFVTIYFLLGIHPLTVYLFHNLLFIFAIIYGSNCIKEFHAKKQVQD